MLTRKHIQTYCVGATAYGFARSLYQVKDVHVQTKDSKRVPMLCVDKAISVVASTSLAPLILPIYMYKDLAWLEIKANNWDPQDYE